MFAEKTKELIEDAIKAEYENAKEKWGDKYASMHEGYGVLQEEILECRAGYKAIAKCNRLFMNNLMKGYNREQINYIEACRDNALHLAMEACQVAAVCKKMLDGVGK